MAYGPQTTRRRASTNGKKYVSASVSVATAVAALRIVLDLQDEIS